MFGGEVKTNRSRLEGQGLSSAKFVKCSKCFALHESNLKHCPLCSTLKHKASLLIWLRRAYLKFRQVFGMLRRKPAERRRYHEINTSLVEINHNTKTKRAAIPRNVIAEQASTTKDNSNESEKQGWMWHIHHVFSNIKAFIKTFFSSPT